MKNILAIMAMLALIAWGIYDISHSPANSGMSTGVEQGEKQKKATVGINKGNIAPDFELQTLDGTKMKLSDFRGKKLIVNLWATWCPPCRAEMPDMQAFYEEQKEDNIAVLAVNLTQSDNKEKVAAFIKEFGLSFPVVLDVDNKVADTYQVVSIPTSYIIDSKGVIQEKIIGPMDKEMMDKLMSSID